uniref:Titin n=1 Tax=Gopherus agassizii TaxID=38772 RepID=A0A452HGV7_9SAUR
MIPFKGRPPPTVTWRKGEKNLGIDERYNIQNTESSTLLNIPQVTRNDTGKYILTIENGVGEPKSSFVNVKVLDTPSACQKLQLKHVSRGTVTLIWEPPLINGGSEITNYVIEKRDATKRAWSTVTTKCSHTTFKVTNLSEKTSEESLYMPLLLVCLLGMNSLINMSEYIYFILSFFLVPPTIEFGAEHFEGLTVKAGESIRLKVLIKGRPVPQVTWFKDGKEIEKKMNIEIMNVIGSSTIFVRDATRDHRVMAENAAGVGPPSAVSRLIKCREPVNPPSAPTVVKVTDTSKTSVSLEWTKPVFDGGMEIIGYIIEMSTKYTVTDLEAGEHYKFRVSAVNGAGKGESCEVPATIQATDRLSSPEIDIDANFKQTHIVRAGATIRLFIAFLGKPVPTATWSKADSDLSLRADIHITDSFSTLTVENCNRNDAGKYVFTVENVSGSKSITFTVKVLDTPGPPGPITFKDVTRGSITLMWDAPVLDGGARIHHYIVEKREASRRSWQVVSSKCTRQIFKVTDLAEGVPFYYRVSAENEYGVGEPCELTEPVVATEEPAPPKRLDIIDTTKSSAVLAWLKPDHDGGSRVTGYLLEMKQKGSDYWAEAGQTKQLTFTVEGLLENNEYEFRVKAKNDAGYSEPREAFSSVIIKEPQIEPTADLSGITRQLITCKAGSTFTIDIPITTKCSKTFYRLTGLIEGAMYYFRVLPENIYGIGEPCETSDAVLVSDVPMVPQKLEVVDITKSTVTLAWEKPQHDGGSRLTGYVIEASKAGTEKWMKVVTLKPTVFEHTIISLNEGEQYLFRVRAQNQKGVSEPREIVTAVTVQDQKGRYNS